VSHIDGAGRNQLPRGTQRRARPGSSGASSRTTYNRHFPTAAPSVRASRSRLFALIVILSAGCSAGEEICENCLVVSAETDVILGSLEGEDALVSIVVAVAHVASSYYVYDWNDPGSLLRRYDGDGRFLGFVGRSGSGPGEFIQPGILVPLDQEQLGIIDIQQRRLTVLQDQQVRGTYSLPAISGVFMPAPLSGGRILLNGRYSADEAIGLPLHVLSSTGRIVRSFGADPAVLGDWTSRAFLRVSAESVDGSVWAANPYAYLIERWDTTGALVQSIRRHVAWFPDITDPVYVDPHMVRSPTPRVVALWEDTQRRHLWVFIRRARDDWADQVEPIVLPSGRKHFRFTTAPTMMYNTQVEVLDARSGVVIGSGMIPIGINGVLSDGRAYSVGLESELPRLRVWRLTLHSEEA
jgi:hypothetical protein